ncbi:MAG: Nif3-like dinuclear metal center hexameric protein [Crenarchaeota archaeon]|nr:Nif3-like dinuclear metal center hexameric protein [Thermoproteota archaeon]
MADIHKITEFLNKYLGVQNFEDIDIIINGLEIEGREDVKKIMTAVSLTENVLDRCIEEDCDTIILHHGILMRGSRGAELVKSRIEGSLRDLLKKILQNDINILAYHLPLDAHPEIGNNITIARLLSLRDIEWIPERRGPPIGVIGELEKEIDRIELLSIVREKINENARLLPHGPEKVRRIAVVSGAGSDYVTRFRRGEIDLLITGEVKEHNEVYAINEKINVIIAGHYATEVYGPKNLAELLRRRFEVETMFAASSQYV